MASRTRKNFAEKSPSNVNKARETLQKAATDRIRTRQQKFNTADGKPPSITNPILRPGDAPAPNRTPFDQGGTAPGRRMGPPVRRAETFKPDGTPVNPLMPSNDGKTRLGDPRRKPKFGR